MAAPAPRSAPKRIVARREAPKRAEAPVPRPGYAVTGVAMKAEFPTPRPR